MTGTKLRFWSPIKYCNTQLGKHRVSGNTLLAEVQSPAADTGRTKNSCALEVQRGSLQLQCKDAILKVQHMATDGETTQEDLDEDTLLQNQLKFVTDVIAW
jgi:hypothetical protein